MNTVLRLFCCAILFSISGCQRVQQDAYKDRALEQCKMACVQHFEFCKQNCVDNCPTCSISSNNNAAKNFAKYVSESEIEGKKVMRELNSYRDPLQCRKVSCDCLSDFAMCNKGCTGVIPKKLHAVPYCV